MANALNDIANRLTPSVPQEITYAAQPTATGRKFATLFAHMAQVPGTGMPYQVYRVVNVGVPASAQAEVDAVAGFGSQAGKMAYAFVAANALIAQARSFPAFQIVLLPYTELYFGPNQEAILAAQNLRCDFLVSCYPAGDSTNRTTLLNLANLLTGPDRDLQGQFGSFAMFGSIEPLSVQVGYAINSRAAMVASNPDTNTALVNIIANDLDNSNVLTNISQAPVTVNGILTAGSTTIAGISSTAGIYAGASITGSGIPVGAIVENMTATTLLISAPATSSESSEPLVVTNLPTAGIYPGASITGSGVPVGTVVESISPSTITMSNAATGTANAIAIAVQNQVSNLPEELAAAQAATLLSLAFPYNPAQGLTVGGLVPSQKTSDRIYIDPNGTSEQALAAGLSPFYTQPGNTVGMIRSLTTYNLLPDGVTTATSYIDWQDIVALYDFREDMYEVSQNPPFNGNPGGTKATTTIAAFFKDELIRVSSDYEDQGAFQNVKQLAPYYQVVPSTTSRGRFDFRVPEDVVPGLIVIAGNIVAVSDLSQLASFTL
jgi:hypothetical protein